MNNSHTEHDCVMVQRPTAKPDDRPAVFYGVNGDGLGHCARALAIAPGLVAAGWRVLFFSRGRALATLHRVLKPGGVLLLTVPGISQTDRGEWGETWHWSLTGASMRRLLADGWEHVSVETHGNVLSAISFLHGLCVADLTEEELATNDPAYPLVVTARAAKPTDGT